MTEASEIVDKLWKKDGLINPYLIEVEIAKIISERDELKKEPWVVSGLKLILKVPTS